MPENRLIVKNLTVKYRKTIAVDSLNFSLKNETIVFFGSSGCGKTSILKAILGVSQPGMKTSGDIILDGVQVVKGSGDIGMTFQGPVIPPWLQVFDLCRLGSKIKNLAQDEQRERIISMLKLFNISQLERSYPSNMSGGEKQRTALAVTLLNEPKVLLLDEPTTFIDGVNRIAIWNYLEKKVYPLKIPTIIVSHDPTEAITLGDRVFLLNDKARISKIIDIPFPHPRNEEISKQQAFWELKNQLVKENFQGS